jgi:hypothetical protein
MYLRWCLIGWVMLVLVQGCTYNHTLNTSRAILTDVQLLDRHQLDSGRDWVAPRTSTWLVAVSRDGLSRAMDQQVSRQLAASMRQAFASVVLANEAAGPATALQQARHNRADFMVYPQLLQAGDGAYSFSEWLALSKSGSEQAFGRDRATVVLLIFDVHSSQLLDTVKLTMHESWLPSVNGQFDAKLGAVFDEFARHYSYQQAVLPH